MKNNNGVNQHVLQGLCLKCFYLIYDVEQDMFECDKFHMKLDGKVESCPGYMVISEGLNEMIIKMKANGELPEWVGK